MLFKEQKLEFEINGVKGFFSVGKIARKAHVAVFAGLGDTRILASVGVGEANPELDFFPLTVEYIERMAAAGIISGSRFVKRERNPSDDAVLRGRIIDRSLRPMFPTDFRNETQVVVEVLAYDEAVDPNILAVNAASLALLLSKAPFTTPVSAVRIGYMKDSDQMEQILRVTAKPDRDDQRQKEKLNLVIAGDGKNVTNLDADAYEVAESEILKAMKLGLEQMSQWIDAQKKFVDMVKPVKGDYFSFALPQELVDEVKHDYADAIKAILDISASEDPQFTQTLLKSSEETKKIMDEMAVKYEGKYSKVQQKEVFEKVAKKVMREFLATNKKRMDGREFEEVREFECEVGILPRVHGTGMFSRGLTQVLSTISLGSIKKAMIQETMTGEDTRSFMHFYTQYPFTMGHMEKYKYNPGRREIGHGALAEKALIPVLPSLSEFPYTIIVSSDVMSENGSSSQACSSASSLALMDAGVPIKKHVAGIACGVVFDEENPDEYHILTDIRDIEDFYGFMDFKVAGTRDGVTAVQFDTKAQGLPYEVFEKAIVQSTATRMKILDTMYDAISEPRATVSQYAPKVSIVHIPVEKIGELIGPGGKNIKELSEDTNTEINVEEDGTVNIFSEDQEGMERAKKYVESLSFMPEIGKTYKGEVVAIMDYGAFVDIAPNVSGLVHVSEMADEFVKDVRSFVSNGQIVDVKIIDIGRDGKIKLSMKATKQTEEGRE